MSEPLPTPASLAYQLRVVLRGISPLIWRRLLVPGDSSVADLHATLQPGFRR
jgi:pRiA4b ORF-3-like protein